MRIDKNSLENTPMKVMPKDKVIRAKIWGIATLDLLLATFLFIAFFTMALKGSLALQRHMKAMQYQTAINHYFINEAKQLAFNTEHNAAAFDALEANVYAVPNASNINITVAVDAGQLSQLGWQWGAHVVKTNVKKVSVSLQTTAAHDTPNHTIRQTTFFVMRNDGSKTSDIAALTPLL
ncbi:hypothetical protein N9V74_04815 [Alteromonas sp.]|nr:hypothetical protein [Alteromonas sp.]